MVNVNPGPKPFLENRKVPVIDTERKLFGTRDEFLSLEYEEKTFEASTNKKEDIVISGLGFVAINKKAKVLVKIIKKTDVFKRAAII